MKEALEYFKIGKIVKTKGLKGELKVYSHTDDIERFLDLKKFYIGKDRENKYGLEKVSIISPNMVVVKIKDYNTIESVQAFVNQFMYVDRDETYELDEDEFFIADMIGMEVYTVSDEKIGILVDVLQYTANDVYVVKNEEGKEYLIPATYEIVPKIDMEERRIYINPITGLL